MKDLLKEAFDAGVMYTLDVELPVAPVDNEPNFETWYKLNKRRLNGWIPVSERLPEINQEIELTEKYLQAMKTTTLNDKGDCDNVRMHLAKIKGMLANPEKP